MRKLLVPFTCTSLIFCLSCGNAGSSADHGTAADSSAASGSATSAKEPTQAQKNSQNIRAVYKGIESGDVSAMDAFTAGDVVDHDSPHGELKGLDSVKKMLGDMHNHFSDLKINVLAEATDGDYNLTMASFNGKTKDASMGMPANMTMSDTSVDVVKIVNGKLTEHWSFNRPRPMHSNMAAKHPKKEKM